MERLPQSFRLRLLACLWIACIVGGTLGIAAYSNAPTRSSEQRSLWPRNAGIKRRSDRPTLLALLHPQCPCSRATIHELSRLLSQSPISLDLKILLYEPNLPPARWQQSSLASEARLLPGALVIVDHDGAIASTFGMSVSGQTALYGANGELLFSGGVTAARGHVGDNAGRSAIRDILSGIQTETKRTPVFGCSIRSQS